MLHKIMICLGKKVSKNGKRIFKLNFDVFVIFCLENVKLKTQNIEKLYFFWWLKMSQIQGFNKLYYEHLGVGFKRSVEELSYMS